MKKEDLIKLKKDLEERVNITDFFKLMIVDALAQEIELEEFISAEQLLKIMSDKVINELADRVQRNEYIWFTIDNCSWDEIEDYLKKGEK